MENILGSRSSLFAQFISFCPRCARTARSPAFRMSMTLADTQKSITTTISVSEITDYLPPSFSTVQPHVLSTPRKLGVSQKSIAQTFSLLRAQGKVAFIPYVTAGDPSLSVTAQALRVLNDSGADIIELGLPHSNPSLDGPVIQASVARSLQNGCDWESVLGMLKKVTPNIEAPIVLFTYYKPILKKGIENFVQAVRSAGVTGLLIPDLPPEEIHKARILTELCGLELVLLTTPTTSKQQMNYISQVSQGFIYLVSRNGVTGPSSTIQPQVENLLQTLRKVTDKPISVGFGICKPEHAIQLRRWGADGVIVGSALVKQLGEAPSPEEGISAIRKFTQEFKKVLS